MFSFTQDEIVVFCHAILSYGWFHKIVIFAVYKILWSDGVEFLGTVCTICTSMVVMQLIQKCTKLISCYGYELSPIYSNDQEAYTLFGPIQQSCLICLTTFKRIKLF